MRGALNFVIIVVSTAVLGGLAMLTALTPGLTERFFIWARIWAWVITAWCGVKVRGSLPASEAGVDWTRPYVYMSNHQSHFDIPCIYRVVPANIRFLTKKELRMIPIFGWALWAAGYVFIDRKKREDAFASIARAAEDFKRKRHAIVVFPEGTRSPDGMLQSFKKGGFHLAIEAGAKIIPIGVTGTTKVLPKHALFVRPGDVMVRVGAPIDASKFRRNDKDDLAKLQGEVRAAIETLTRDG
ncbi:MAG: 1-acyl-sn-glycerol-3-phosphate acyltransferase [Deltaproteobacteria bacterium]|nr:1-acyl-sn-glycerol-3-phosphate acyltransferase [Deltaproteobacteria bacterium]